MEENKEDAPERTESVPSFSGSNSPSRQGSPTKKLSLQDLGGKNDYIVTATVTVALAYVQTSDETTKLMDELLKKNKKTVEAPKPQQFFHCEYTVAPGHDATICDVVTYGVAAKLFSESDSRVVKTWDDGNLTWIAWNHSHDIIVNKSKVLDLYEHLINFQLWLSKDKVSTKARFDRPKAFRLPQQKSGAPGRGVAAVVAKQSQSWTSLQPKDSAQKGLNDKTVESPPTLEPEEEAEPTHTLPIPRVRSSLARLAGIMAPEQSKRRIEELKLQKGYLMAEISKHKKPRRPSKDDGSKNKELSKAPSATNNTQRKPRESNSEVKSTNIQIKLKSLFGGSRNDITYRLEEEFGCVKDMFVGLSLSDALLPKDLEQELNPLIITIKAVKDLPDAPVSRESLANSCIPVYCSYTFPTLPTYFTRMRSHEKDVYFEDQNVILAGLIDPGKFFEYIQSSRLTVEVHDRDRKIPESFKPPTIFGEEIDDKKIGNVGWLSGKKTTHNAFHDRKRVYDPFGVAELVLTDLLKGQKTINFHVVVKPCQIPDLLSDPNKPYKGGLVGVMGSVDRPEDPPLPPGDYIHAGTVLKVKMEVRHSLKYDLTPQNSINLHKEACPFTRIVCYFKFDNKRPLHMIDRLFKEANARALNLDQFEPHIVDAALATYKLSLDQKESRTLDVVNGFHVIDGLNHFIVLEGLRLGAIADIINQVEQARQQDSFSDVTFLYDSSFMFTSRLYCDLDVTLCAVRLHQPLDVILNQPLLYVRDLVPRPCFDCLTRVKTMLDLSHFSECCSLLPTCEMILSMSREFGIPLSFADYEGHHTKEEEVPEETAIKPPVKTHKRPTRRSCLDNLNQSFIDHVESRVNEKCNFVVENMIAVQEVGKRRRPKPILIYGLPQGKTTHNYSTQTMNSMELAKKTLRRLLYEKDPESRYTFHQLYNSSMVDPVTWEEYYQMLDEEEQRKWKTKEGFVYPGVRPSMLCNKHSLRPATSRIEELRLKWRENVLHSNVLEPTIKHRQQWTWEDRFKDMELFQKPQQGFGSGPLSIHLPGDKRSKEKADAEISEKKKWKSKIVVDDITMRFHRVGATTEQTNKSNQIDRLRSLLKDDPKKLSLKMMPANKLPPLSVVKNPAVDMEPGARAPSSGRYTDDKNVGFIPGPCDVISWKMDKNRIAIRDPNHKLFEDLKGNDFNPTFYEHDYFYKRAAVPLTDDERDVHYFKIPPLIHQEGEDFVKEKDKDLVPLGRSEYRERFDEERSKVNKRSLFLPRHQYGGVAMDNKTSPFKSDMSYVIVPDEGATTQAEEQRDFNPQQAMLGDNSVMMVEANKQMMQA